MRHLFIAALMYAASLASWAQAYNPTVAYTKQSGTTWSIYLANEDGTHAVPVYSSAKKVIGAIDFAPGGGRIAFSQQGGGLKVLPYTATNSGITVGALTTLDPGLVETIDFSPDGSKIIYVVSPTPTSTQEIRTVPVTGGATTTLITDQPGETHISEVAWMKSGTSFAYTQGFRVDLRTELRMVSVDNLGNLTSSPTVLMATNGSFTEITRLSSARTKDSLLVNLNGPYVGNVVQCDIVGDTCALSVLVPGTVGRFSRDDSKVVFIDASRAFVNSYTVSSGITVPLTKRGTFGTLDTRP